MKTTNEVETNCFAIKNANGEAIELAMQELWVSGTVMPVGADLVARHTFQCADEKPVEAIYTFGLPRDASLHSFRIEGENFSMRSELKPQEEARETYEEGIEKGSLSTLARQHRDGLVSLSVGNLRPRETVTVYLRLIVGVEPRDDGFRLRFPFTLAPGYHPRARMAATTPNESEIELPAGEFGDVILPPFRKDAENLHRVGFNLDILSPLDQVVEISSPSHPLRTNTARKDIVAVSLGSRDDLPNKDLVLDATTSAADPIILAGEDSAGRGQFMAVVPSTAFGETEAAARNIVFLLDSSGSMQGEPMAEVQAAVAQCVDALSEKDTFGIVAFDNKTEAMSAGMLPATAANRERAREFIASVYAGGGTEIADAIGAACRQEGNSGANIFMLTDGQVYGTEDIINCAKRHGTTIHTLGIGSAAQDRFIALLARGTGGTARFVTPREDISTVAAEMFAAIGRPLARNLKVSVSGLGKAELEPQPHSAIYKGSPLVLYGSTDQLGSGRLEIEWTEPEPGHLEMDLCIPSEVCDIGKSLRLLRGARLLTDLDAEFRDGKEDRERMEALSREYGLASRCMSLVAVVERADDQPGQPPRTKIVPVGLPEGVGFASYFNPVVVHRSLSYKTCRMMCEPSVEESARYFYENDQTWFEQMATTSTHVQDILDNLVARIETDGGMPGADKRERLANTLVALRLLQTVARREYKRYERRLLDFTMHCEIGLLPHFATRIEEGLDRIDAQLGIIGNAHQRNDAWKDAATELLDGKLDTDKILEALQI